MMSRLPEVAESRALTGLRGLAAMLVVMHHASLHFTGAAALPVVGGVLRRGYLGVDLFFVLSGFVMSMVYGAWFGDGGARAGHAAPTFLVRRVARVWPLHAAVLAAILGVVAAEGGGLPSVRFTVANLLMVQGWGVSGEVNAPAWSVSAEFLAYLLFPLLAGPLLRRRAGGAWGLAGVGVLLWACLALAPPVGPARRGLLDIHMTYSVLPALRCLAGFTLGMLAWRARRVPVVRHLAGRRWAGPAALALAAALLAAGHDLLVLALLPAVVLGMHHGRGWAWRVLGGQPLHGIGTLSYAVYLIHYAVLQWVPPDAEPRLTVLALYGAAVLLLAAFAHYLVERPTRRLMRWLGEAVVPALGPVRDRGPGWGWPGQGWLGRGRGQRGM